MWPPFLGLGEALPPDSGPNLLDFFLVDVDAEIGPDGPFSSVEVDEVG